VQVAAGHTDEHPRALELPPSLIVHAAGRGLPRQHPDRDHSLGDEAQLLRQLAASPASGERTRMIVEERSSVGAQCERRHEHTEAAGRLVEPELSRRVATERPRAGS